MLKIYVNIVSDCFSRVIISYGASKISLEYLNCSTIIFLKHFVEIPTGNVNDNQSIFYNLLSRFLVVSMISLTMFPLI